MYSKISVDGRGLLGCLVVEMEIMAIPTEESALIRDVTGRTEVLVNLMTLYHYSANLDEKEAPSTSDTSVPCPLHGLDRLRTGAVQEGTKTRAETLAVAFKPKREIRRQRYLQEARYMGLWWQGLGQRKVKFATVRLGEKAPRMRLTGGRKEGPIRAFYKTT
ncbi:hypothetical protein P692DRAFT_201805195 [Suillus brevipes Sb2]|nr:hypothetical protein P692DRAFT_201805195 [Suillus brevipes Sb2]